MKKTLTTQVGSDGVLHLSLPLGAGDAMKAVRVTVETLDDPPATTPDRAAWTRFIERTAGAITDPTFERQPQGEFEARDALS